MEAEPNTAAKKPSLFIDLLAIGRVANLPSVISNVLTGCIMACYFFRGADFALPQLNVQILFLLTCACMSYLAGCFFNDWHDIDWDQKHKTHRPVPSGRVQKKTILAIVVSLTVASLTLSLFIGSTIFLTNIAIFVTIIIYTLWHKKTPLAVLPMGVCRSLLYVMGIVYLFEITNIDPLGFWNPIRISHDFYYGIRNMHWSTHWNIHFLEIFYIAFHLAPPLIGIICYIAGLSLLARNESNPVKKTISGKSLAILLLLTPVLTHSYQFVIQKPTYILTAIPLASIISVSLVILKNSIGNAVSLLLAGIVTIDWIILLSVIHFGTGFGPPLIPLSYVAIIFCCFPLALLLQKIAPAT